MRLRRLFSRGLVLSDSPVPGTRQQLHVGGAVRALQREVLARNLNVDIRSLPTETYRHSAVCVYIRGITGPPKGQ